MASLHLRHLFLFALFLAVLTTCVLADDSPDKEDVENFQSLLNSVPEDRLHAILHDYEPSRFKHGVFQEDRTAMEAVHRDNAAVATKLIRLAKRQSNTTSTPPSKPSDTPTENKSTPPPSPMDGSSTAATTGGKATAPQTTAQQPATQSTFITSQIVRTSTAPDGSRSTVTEYTVVGAPVEPPGQTGSKTNNAKPSLQAGAATRNGLGPVGGLVAGVLVGIFAL
ncbi:hypothetical protein GP486_008293 [Trichoglossum hirsutum]|uniref:GPI anchored protein n=1 Tax=Trichoglossum hirsutum TaxID=265104 RepID=A0A9P8L768_9PEZI|nr:hypothetical protein GP486_008293 [Trichoglossum hirsutum]